MFTFPVNQYSDLAGLQMVTTWNTENLGATGSATKVILLPMAAGPSVDWGDGVVNNLNTHTYASGGVKTVKIYGAVTGFRFINLGDKLKITNVSNVGGLNIDNSSMFYGCSNMTWTATNAPIITAGSLNTTFRDCLLFNSPSINNWPMGGITNVGSMLRNTAFDQDISNWIWTSITVAQNLFRDSSFSATNYDLALPAIEAQSVQDNVTAHFGSATYGAGAPATAHANLIADHTWTFTDGGPT